MLYSIMEPSWKLSINVENYHSVHNEEIEVYNKAYRWARVSQIWVIIFLPELLQVQRGLHSFKIEKKLWEIVFVFVYLSVKLDAI